MRRPTGLLTDRVLGPDGRPGADEHAVESGLQPPRKWREMCGDRRVHAEATGYRFGSVQTGIWPRRWIEDDYLLLPISRLQP